MVSFSLVVQHKRCCPRGEHIIEEPDYYRTPTASTSSRKIGQFFVTTWTRRRKIWQFFLLAAAPLFVTNGIVPAAAEGQRACTTSDTPLSEPCWRSSCGSILQTATALCGPLTDNLFRLFAAGSCFNADFTRDICCSGNPAQPVANPFCFSEDLFRALDPHVCCSHAWTRLRVPRVFKSLDLFQVGGETRCEMLGSSPSAQEGADAALGGEQEEEVLPAAPPVMVKVRPTVERILGEVCPEALPAYRIVDYLQNVGPEAALVAVLGQRSLALAEGRMMESRGGVVQDTVLLPKDPMLGREVGRWEDWPWVDTVKHRIPYFGLLLAVWRRIFSPEEVKVLEGGEFEPQNLLSDGDESAALLQLAIRFFKEDVVPKGAGTFSSFPAAGAPVELDPSSALSTLRRERGSRKTPSSDEDYEATNKPLWEQFLARAEERFRGQHKFLDEATGLPSEAALYAHVLLDRLWTMVDAPTRWRDIDYTRDDIWARLFEAAAFLEHKAEKISPRSSHQAGANGVSPGLVGGPRRNAHLAVVNETITPEYALPFLYFLDDTALWEDAESCRHYFGIMAELRTSSDRNFLVLDVGAGTAPCEHQWTTLGPHVKYMKQDFSAYQTSEDPEAYSKRVHALAHSLGLSPFAYTSSIHNKKGYAKLDIVSDITNIPLPDESGRVRLVP